MKLLITGATGFIGKELCKALAMEGHELFILTRKKSATFGLVPAPHTVLSWDDSALPSDLEGVIHLAGESIVGKRWSDSFKAKILNSRVQGTHALIKLLEKSGTAKLKVFITASAVGFYGDTGSEMVSESSPSGTDFLAKVCQQWENALFSSTFSEVRSAEVRKVALRFGVVLGKGGGALEEMISAFSLGVGASLGSGNQWMSWIHLNDLISIVSESLRNNRISGPVNVCTPNPVSHREFIETLANQLHSRVLFRIPGSLLSIALGEVAQTLLTGQRVLPEKLESLGFQFQYPHLEPALNSVCQDSVSLGYTEFLNQVWVPKPIEQVFGFFSSVKNLEAITPPWLNFSVLSESTPVIEKGTQIVYQLKLHGIPLKWKTEISEWNPPFSFVDTQLKGPYQFWQHRHQFQTLREGTLIEDRVLYRLPLGVLGKSFAGPFVKNDVAQIFEFRSQSLEKLLLR